MDDEQRQRGRHAVAVSLGAGYALGWVSGAAFVIRWLYSVTR